MMKVIFEFTYNYKLFIGFVLEMVSWHGLLLRQTEHFWENIRHFAFNNPTIFEIFFLMLYSLEQITLVLLVSNFSTTERLNIIISLFSIDVIKF